MWPFTKRFNYQEAYQKQIEQEKLALYEHPFESWKAALEMAPTTTVEVRRRLFVYASGTSVISGIGWSLNPVTRLIYDRHEVYDDQVIMETARQLSLDFIYAVQHEIWEVAGEILLRIRKLALKLENAETVKRDREANRLYQRYRVKRSRPC